VLDDSQSGGEQKCSQISELNSRRFDGRLFQIVSAE